MLSDQSFSPPVLVLLSPSFFLDSDNSIHGVNLPRVFDVRRIQQTAPSPIKLSVFSFDRKPSEVIGKVKDLGVSLFLTQYIDLKSPDIMQTAKEFALVCDWVCCSVLASTFEVPNAKRWPFTNSAFLAAFEQFTVTGVPYSSSKFLKFASEYGQ